MGLYLALSFCVQWPKESVLIYWNLVTWYTLVILLPRQIIAFPSDCRWTEQSYPHSYCLQKFPRKYSFVVGDEILTTWSWYVLLWHRISLRIPWLARSCKGWMIGKQNMHTSVVWPKHGCFDDFVGLGCLSCPRVRTVDVQWGASRNTREKIIWGWAYW